MHHLRLFAVALFAAMFPVGAALPAYQPRLPFTTVFKGKEKFDRLVGQAVRENWRALPIGERTARVGGHALRQLHART